ncbi:hypothetical protein DFH29DRAFT_871108 [Suillus ampliporus]|nr:hypothetical protein DFH29DRAFT_871108 [Suillus ampliporus]
MNQESLCRGPMLSLSNIANELRCHILGFFRIMKFYVVHCSVELQYAIELGAQRLVSVHPPTVSTADCLCMLREKANAWSSFKLNAAKHLFGGQVFNPQSITHRQLGLAWYYVPKDDQAPGITESSYGYYIDETHDLLVTVDIWETRPDATPNTDSWMTYTGNCMYGIGMKEIKPTHIELYDVENLSKAPQLQATFTLPFRTSSFTYRYPSVFHSASEISWHQMNAGFGRQTPQTESCVTGYLKPGSIFAITAPPFIMNIPPPRPDTTSEDRLNPRDPDTHSVVHTMGFNPSTVARGIGNVVRESTTFPGRERHPEQDVPVTTHLPCIEVVSDRILHCEASAVVLDEETISISSCCPFMAPHVSKMKSI